MTARLILIDEPLSRGAGLAAALARAGHDPELLRRYHIDVSKAGKLGFGGLATTMPVYTGIMTVAFFGSLGLPGMSGFIGEVLALMGAWRVYPVLTIISAVGILLGAAYFLWTIQRMFLGAENEDWKGLPDVNGRELLTLVPLGVLVILLGVLPWIATNLSAETVSNLQVVQETIKSLAKL